MNDPFMAAMGLNDDQYDPQNMQALAQRLRGQRDLGAALSLSPTAQVQALGQKMYNDPMTQAQQIGNRRQQALTRTRQAERDAENDSRWGITDARAAAAEQRKTDEHRRKMAEIYDPTTMKQRVQDGETVTYAVNRSTGMYEEVPELYGKQPSTSGYKGVTRSDDDPRNWKAMTTPAGEKYMQNMQTGEIRYADGSVSPEEMGDIKGTVKYGETYGGERGKASAEWVDNAVDSGYAAAQSKRALMQPLNDILQATREGARTGHLWNMLPDMTDVAGRFTGAVDALTLDNLTQYQLTPVSNTDIAVLKSAAVPVQSNEATAAWAEHKIQAFELLAKADEAVADYINEIGRRPNAADRAKMKQIVDGIVGDFDFTFKQATDTPETPTKPTWDEMRNAYPDANEAELKAFWENMQ